MDERLRSFKCYFKDSGALAMVIIVPNIYTAKEINKIVFKGVNVIATEERSNLVNKELVD